MISKIIHQPLARTVRLRYQVIAFSVIRTFITTGYRMVYPFRTVIARGLGVELSAMDQAIAARSALGIFGPLLGAISDARGRRFALLLGLALFVAAMALVTLWPTYPALFISLLAAGTGKIIFDASAQAYLGDNVPYRQRGRAIALYELSWSWAFLIGMPIAGWLIAASGWNTPFPFIAALAAASLLFIWRVIPGSGPAKGARSTLSSGIRSIITAPAALGALALAACVSSGNEIIAIIFGQWLETAFAGQFTAVGITAAVALGTSATVIGVAELGGEGLVAAISDRLGKRRAVGLGLGGSILTSLMLPVLGTSLEGALAGLFLFYITFEFSLVTMLSLMTEITPGARATLLAGSLALQSIGRALGALAGPALFASGIAANSFAAALLNSISLLVLILFVRENGSPEEL